MSFIDRVLLDVTEHLCRRFQALSGRTNVWLAVQLTNLSIVVYFVWAGAVFWSDDWPSRILLAVFCGGLLYILTQTIFKEPIEASEASAFRRLSKGYRNPRRVRDLPLRVSFLTLSIVFCYPTILIYEYQHLPIVFLHVRIQLVLLTYSLIVLTTVVLYLLACDPLPPCAGKVRAWLQSMARAAPRPMSRPATEVRPEARRDRRLHRGFIDAPRLLGARRDPPCRPAPSHPAS
jgi:hypothetical protein